MRESRIDLNDVDDNTRLKASAGQKRNNVSLLCIAQQQQFSLYAVVGMLCLLGAWCFSKHMAQERSAAELATLRKTSIAGSSAISSSTSSSSDGVQAAVLLPSVAAFTNPIPGARQHFSESYSQLGQDKLVDKILKNMTGGFFVESGAFDGVHISNSWYLETQRGWKGLLVEANPHLYRKIIDASRRNVSVIHACLSPTNQPTVLPFRLGGPVGGLVDHMSKSHAERVSREIENKEPWMVGDSGSGKVLNVSCWPLHSMLKVLGVNRVDYWSLDTEGSEPAILAATDFDAVDIRVLTIEVADEEAQKRVKAIMGKRPEYRLHSQVEFDLVYVKDNVPL